MDDQLVTIKSFSQPWEAELARATLEVQEIPAFVKDAHTVSINWLYSNAIGGVKLQVPEPFVEAATKALASQPEPSPSDSQEEMDAPSIRRGRRWIFLTGLLIILAANYGFTGSCRVYVEASLLLAGTGQSMSGEKRLETCDGTAVGTMSVARPGTDWIPPEIQGIPEPPPPAPPPLPPGAK